MLLTEGGDARITLEPATGLNRYLSAPYPRDIIAYSSSTVSDISPEAFAHLLPLVDQSADYAERLQHLRGRIRAAFSLSDDTRIVFAPSGTDLEYAALAAVFGKAAGGVHNVLLGADEIGSGCIHSARGRYFAGETALGLTVEPAGDVAGCEEITTVDVPVRCGAGQARESAEIIAEMAREIETARAAGKHCLVHGVHGSKTGLVLPGLHDIEALQARFGADVTFVIDACQARITSTAIAEYLARGAIVLMTGSKFIGAPPFNGWALFPAALMEAAAPLPSGFATIFRRAEWPEGWAGAEQLPEGENLPLALRLEAALFEAEKFQQLSMAEVSAIIAAFEDALAEHLISALNVRRITPGGAAQEMPIEMRTLATIDVSNLPGLTTFEQAQSLHRELALEGVRLGQPVKCVALDEGGWGGTLRIGLSMPQITRWAAMDANDIAVELSRDMQKIAGLLQHLTTKTQ
ncbi:hypothetical protein [Qipengyuania sp. ASV99]|uniref:hypothetical protein n=1 Tax=Qipengyuania sp. ASV99 TaxID=3399681 RepID=UPI003A4C5B6D